MWHHYGDGRQRRTVVRWQSEGGVAAKIGQRNQERCELGVRQWWSRIRIPGRMG